MASDRSLRLAVLLWWKLPATLDINVLRKACRRSGFSLSLDAQDLRNKEVARRAIKSVFVGCDCLVVGSYRKYRRFQVVRKYRKRLGTVEWETVDFVRVFYTGRVICEAGPEREEEIRVKLLVSERKVNTRGIDTYLDGYLKSLGAIKLGNVYVVPFKADFRAGDLRRFFRTIASSTRLAGLDSGTLYTWDLRKGRDFGKVMGYLQSSFITELHGILRYAIRGGNKVKNRAVRKKNNLKRRVKYWEEMSGYKMWSFRRILANTVLEYPEIEDERDEWRQRR